MVCLCCLAEGQSGDGERLGQRGREGVCISIVTTLSWLLFSLRLVSSRALESPQLEQAKRDWGILGVL